ncbi:MAG TPA: VOC family protein [Methylomirabilota bacterium]|nr:VOC family protein [Methylomirabilota bacterium]
MVRLQHVGATFPPGQADTIRGFYGGVLGLTEMTVPPEVADQGWVWFATRDAGIELHFIPDALPPDPRRRHHFCLQVDDLAGARRRVEAARFAVTEPGSQIYGRERFFVRDPLDNLVELVELTSTPAGGAELAERRASAAVRARRRARRR